MKGLWCYILPIGCVILIFPSSGETAWHQNFFQSLGALFLGTDGSEHDNYKLSRHPDSEHSVSAPSSLQVHQGIPDVTTTASRLFRLELSDKTFSAPACYYEVHEVDGSSLPHWLYFNQTSNTLLGVPSSLEQGVYFIEITAYAKCSEGSIGTAITATTNFLIQVQAANRLSSSKSHGLLGDELQPDGNHNIVLSMQRNEHNCDSSDIVIRNTVILDSTLVGLTSMQVEEQITVLYKLAQFLQRDVYTLTLTARRSGAIAKLLNVDILVAGPGNVGLETNNTGVEISWVLACGVFTQAAEVSRVMEHNVQGGRLAAELGYDIIGWYLSQEVPLGGVASRRKRQARNGFHTATPTPTPTVYVTTLPSRLSDISSESPVLSTTSLFTFPDSISSSMPIYDTTFVSPSTVFDIPSSTHSHSTGNSIDLISSMSSVTLSASFTSFSMHDSSTATATPSLTLESSLTPVVPSEETRSSSSVLSEISSVFLTTQEPSLTDTRSEVLTNESLLTTESLLTVTTASVQTIPTASLETVLESEIMPTESALTVTDTETMSTESKLTVTDTETMSTESQITVTDSETMSTESLLTANPSLTAESLPMLTLSEVPTTDSSLTLTEGTPSTTSVSSLKSEVLPSETELASSMSDEMPTESSLIVSETIQSESEKSTSTSSYAFTPVLPTESLTTTYVTDSSSSLAVVSNTSQAFTTELTTEITLTDSSYLMSTESTLSASETWIVPTPSTRDFTAALSTSLPPESVLTIFDSETPLTDSVPTVGAIASTESSLIITEKMSEDSLLTATETVMSSGTQSMITVSETDVMPVETSVATASSSLEIVSSSSEAVIIEDSFTTLSMLSDTALLTSSAAWSSSDQEHVTSSDSMTTVMSVTSSTVVTTTEVNVPTTTSDVVTSEITTLSTGDAEKLTTETSLSTEEVTEEATEGVTAEVTTADITTAVITPEAETEEPTTETPHQTTPITSDETTAKEVTTEQALTTEADITTGEVTTLKTEESSTQYANESVTTEVSTQGLPNQSPILLNPIDEINTKLGTYFQFLVPLATFYDREDGHTRHLQLSLHDVNMDPLAPDSWVQFHQDEQVIYGIPLEKDQSAEPVDFVLVATDTDGAQAVDVIQFPIDATSVEGMSHKFLMEFDVDFDSFVQETDTLINLLEKLSGFYKDEAPDLITVTGLREGSVMVEWSNNTLSKTECQNETILELFSTMVTDGAVDFYFRQAMLPEFPVTDVAMEFLGACSPALVTEATTEFDNTTEHFVSSGSDYNIWVVTIVPTIFVILLLLLAALLFCLWWYKKNQEQRGRYLLDSEKPTFAQNRKPILLPSELPYPDPVNRPKKPSILETEQQPYTYVNKSYQPPEDAQSLPPPYHLPKDGDYGDLGASPPPGYYPGEGAPPSYRLPPPYPSFPGSSEI